MKLKIAFIFPDLVKGGAEQLMSALANSLVDNNFDVQFISLGSPKVYDYLSLNPNISIHHFSRAGKLDLKPLKKIKAHFDHVHIDIVCCVDFFTMMYMGITRLVYNLKMKIILAQHTTVPLKKGEWINSYLAGMLMKKTDKVIFSCISQKDFVENHFLKFNKIPSELIYNGIDFSPYYVPSVAEKAALKVTLLSLNPEKKIILKAAGFRKHKDHITAINALSYYLKTYGENIHLYFLGDKNDAYLQTLISHVDSLGLTNDVTFKDFEKNMAPFLRAVDVFTLTSNSVETFSLSAIAAMASGIPIVLTDVGGAKEMINEENGVLAEAGNPKSIAESWHKAIVKTYNPADIRKDAENKYDFNTMKNKYIFTLKKFAAN